MRRLGIFIFTALLAFMSFVVHASEASSMQLLSGETVQLQGAREKPLYLKFWASWCGQCLAQMHHLEVLHKKHGDKIDVIAVNFGLNDSVDLIEAVRRKYEMTMPIAYDEFGELSRSFDIAVVPYSVIINRAGTVIHRKWGTDGVDEKINELIRVQP